MPPESRRLLLITVSSPGIRRVRRSRVLNFQQITMPYLAAFVPAHWTVQHVDEAVEPVDAGAPVDLVAMTFHTPRAPHVTLLPDEAAEHADAIFVGEAERTWPRFLAEFERGGHARRYESPPPPLDTVPMARAERFHRRDHAAGVLFATRGCRYRCDFCTLAILYQGRCRRREVEQVAREDASFRGRVVILRDDNLTGDLEHAKALFRALAPHRKWWSSQASIHAADDDEFLALAVRSRCKQLFIGLESVSQASVDGAGKPCNRVDDYARAIERIHRHGISVQAGIVFGCDEDTPATFDRTIGLLEATGVQNATFNILTPFPGTRLPARLEAAGRIQARGWSRYNGRADVVFQSRHMSPESLLADYRDACRRFYSPRSVIRRLRRSPVQLPRTLPLNLAYATALHRGL